MVAAALATGIAVTGISLSGVPAASASGGRLGDLTDFAADGDTYTVTAGTAKLRIDFADDDLFRVWLAPDGTFADPANEDPDDPAAPDADIVVKRDYAGAESSYAVTDDAYRITTAEAVLTVTKSPVTLSLADEDGTPIWTETEPLSWTDDGTVQSLDQGAQEQFYGGGMQNGRFSHRDETIEISRDYNWNDGGNPNAVPFYLSSRGYGVLRNTFAPGSYDFAAPVRTTHDEQRFDAYYFVGDARDVIDGYTELTGRPAMMPMYALEVGDADCYLHNANRGERETLRDSTAIADGYAENGMPLGWMLVNDGYGCGYEQLPETGQMLNDHGGELGLWTESDHTEQESEVAAGVRVRKTDVAWVGAGYRFALDACEKSQSGIEDNSDDRATVMTIEGWAGTQRCGAMWSGDQYGTWDYIRWQIPTYAGSTMSGQHMTTGDIDGIFGGSAPTYVRDLQWKMLLPMTYAMSGWAASDKQPWRYGQPYTDINKKYLLLHERLLPYFYTHSTEANRNGLGATRPLVLNYPDDPNTWGDKVKYEFLAGDDLLVAPVYSDTSVRDGIYLPEGTWVDYWTGRTYEGPMRVDDYQAPLDTLPLFVRGGAVVPMFPEGTTDWQEGKESGQLDLDVYPQGTSSFTNYEDDGHTQAQADGESATQRFDVTAPTSGRGTVDLTIGALEGEYDAKPTERRYRLQLHMDTDPGQVVVDGRKVPEVRSADALGAMDQAWYYAAEDGVVHVKTRTFSTNRHVDVSVKGGAAVGGNHPENRNVEQRLTTAAIAKAGSPTEMTASFTNNTGRTVKVTRTDLRAPDGWDVRASGQTTKTVEAGETFDARFAVTPPADTEPGRFPLATATSYRVGDARYRATAQASTVVAYAELADGFNNVGVTRLDDWAPGDIDGGGSSFIAERLAEQGASPGATVEANGFSFAWPSAEPGTPGNIAADGQTISLSGQGNALALLGTGTSAAAGGDATVHYTDGSTSTVAIGFPNWCCLPTDRYGAKIALTTKGKNTPTGPAYPTVDYRIYTKTARIDPDKQVAAVTLPSVPSIHVFAMTVGTEEVVPPPIANGTYQLGNVGTSQNLEAPGDTNAGQLRHATPTEDADQKWILTQHDDGSYEVRNVGSGLCADVAASSQTSGAQVVQYTCTLNDNQRWVVSVSDDQLTLKAKHSGMSLTTADGDLVVQATDTGSATQRWSATPTG
ncbi:MAG: DUF5110 domain-containing protein [Propionibacteriales bacterium]|nr:DUF5110 domain-containing protein [Propionibacteriales bacterium]